jgi:hypothetical protein
MKKGAAMGIGLSVIVISIILGIASLPDEVLLENPSLKTSELNPIVEERINTIIPDTVAEEPTPDTVAEESETKSSKENVIRVEIKDGIGSADR